jgi:hypothetical protein
MDRKSDKINRVRINNRKSRSFDEHAFANVKSNALPKQV